MRFHLSALLATALLATTTFVPVDAAAAEYSVTMKGNKFSPSAIRIHVGDTIKFVNLDKVSHVVYSLSPGHYFASGRQAPGESAVINFDRSGAFDAITSGEFGARMSLHIEVATR
jgi:plastocyanin